jgi:hypothetical protein
MKRKWILFLLVFCIYACKTGEGCEMEDKTGTEGKSSKAKSGLFSKSMKKRMKRN